MKQELNVTSFDHEDLKQSLIVFLESTGKFDDFNFEGSTLNTIVDLLVRNTHYDSFLANMLANESFIASAQLRNNVVSHAQKLSYTPRSRTATRAVIDVKVIPADKSNLETNISIPSNTVFLSNVAGQSYQFITKDSYTMTLDGNNDYVVDGVEIFQGQLIANSFSHTTNTAIVIPNQNVDTSTLTVSSIESGLNYVFDYATTISNINLGDDYYFLSENFRGIYEVDFGKNVISREPADGSAISLKYVNTEDTHANGATTFIAGSLIGGFSNIQATTIKKGYGGDDQENIEDIRFLAPKSYQAQDRAVSESDYSVLIKKEFPFVRSIKVWGGEKNDPPVFGSVFISVVSDQGEDLTTAVKNEIISYLEDFSIGSVTSEISNSDKLELDLNIQYALDKTKTSKTFNQLQTDIQSVVDSFNNNRLKNFDKYFNRSRFIDDIMNIAGIESLYLDVTLKKELDKLTFPDPIYNYNFKNPIVEGSLLIENISAALGGTDYVIKDDESGNVVLYYTLSGAQQSQTIGTVDYSKGEVDFTLNMTQDAKTFIMYAKPKDSNIYVYNNKYIEIDETTYSKLRLFTG